MSLSHWTNKKTSLGYTHAQGRLSYLWISQWPKRFPPTRTIIPALFSSFIARCNVRSGTASLSASSPCVIPGLSIISASIFSAKPPSIPLAWRIGELGFYRLCNFQVLIWTVGRDLIPNTMIILWIHSIRVKHLIIEIHACPSVWSMIITLWVLRTADLNNAPWARQSHPQRSGGLL